MDNTHAMAPAHGHPDAADALRGRIYRELFCQAHMPEHLESVTRDASR